MQYVWHTVYLFDKHACVFIGAYIQRNCCDSTRNLALNLNRLGAETGDRMLIRYPGRHSIFHWAHRSTHAGRGHVIYIVTMLRRQSIKHASALYCFRVASCLVLRSKRVHGGTAGLRDWCDGSFSRAINRATVVWVQKRPPKKPQRKLSTIIYRMENPCGAGAEKVTCNLIHHFLDINIICEINK